MSVRVQDTPFDPGAELTGFTAANAQAGGVATFLGQVRGTRGDGTALTAMTLEHYPGMTEKELARIEDQARERWSLDDVVIVHRVGRLIPGEPIVFVATASAHRAAAFEACEFLIDYLKTRAPFWKAEETADGATEWVAAKDGDDERAARWAE